MVSKDPTLLKGWELDIPNWKYLLYCAGIVIAIRLFHCTLKAFSMGLGEGCQSNNWGYWKRWSIAFVGFKEPKVADLWQGPLIGFLEIAFYPVLIFTSNLTVIGAWIAIKTGGNLKLWGDQPRAFSRFLILNLINMGISYLIALNWLVKITL